jgi:hypothetical protein
LPGIVGELDVAVAGAEEIPAGDPDATVGGAFASVGGTQPE